MPAILLDGKTEALNIRAALKDEITAQGLKPGLAVILVGEDPASLLYVALKEKAATAAGIVVHRFDYSTEADEATIVSKIRELNKDEKVNGILVQLPLPEKFNPNAIIIEIDPAKDVDGFHPKNMTGLLSPGIAGPLALMDKTGLDLKGKHAVVAGNSAVFAQSFCDALRERHIRAEPTYPENVKLLGQADILIVAVGRPAFIKPEMVKQGAIVIDIGTNKVDGKTVGDVSPEVSGVASFMTPVPGGVGPMTVAMLLKNVVELYKQQAK
jgi:methylenetetrahydrofolate dehydrogenase (NADP+)/methenyltetrahydrofolate cyclohydrolase